MSFFSSVSEQISADRAACCLVWHFQSSLTETLWWMRAGKQSISSMTRHSAGVLQSTDRSMTQQTQTAPQLSGQISSCRHWVCPARRHRHGCSAETRAADVTGWLLIMSSSVRTQTQTSQHVSIRWAFFYCCTNVTVIYFFKKTVFFEFLLTRKNKSTTGFLKKKKVFYENVPCSVSTWIKGWFILWTDFSNKIPSKTWNCFKASL